MSLLASVETGLELQALSRHFDLVERFLSGVEDNYVASLGHAISHEQGHSSFACTGFAGEESNRGGRKAFSTECVIDEPHSCTDASSEMCRYLDLEDVGAELDALVASLQLHFFSFVGREGLFLSS